ncbi:NAD(P)-binding protein [Lentinus tigrinus ALCF2SS1-7]|uniref:NAD(P)-binding protein n=1 Tax=Lentinus tigrinus ALCF2SS1-7 TaxID=1328758 RepID=UPI001165E9B7|nr:NAD(P)-binding protein [Lentinus tigrinus ALCF2SS1-7]
MSSLKPDTTNIATLISRRFKPEQIPDLTGRVALVTGGSAGIGFHAAAALAQHNAKVLICSANPEHGTNAEKEMNESLKQTGSTGSVQWTQVDFGNLKQVDAYAKRVAQEQDRLDILLLNAAIGQAPFGLTADGLERHFKVDDIDSPSVGYSLKSVTVCIKGGDQPGHRWVKTVGMIHLARQLAQRKLSGLPKPILAMSVHPGTVDTDVQKTWSESYGVLGKVLEGLSRGLGKSAEEGAGASLWAATCTDINGSNWEEFQGSFFMEPYGKPNQSESKIASDQTVGENFWKLCVQLTEELLGERLE